MPDFTLKPSLLPQAQVMDTCVCGAPDTPSLVLSTVTYCPLTVA